MRVLSYGLAVGGLVVACASEPPPKAPPHEDQSFPQAVTMLCEVDRLANVDPEDVLGAEQTRTDYLMEHIKNSDGIYLYTLFRTRDPQGQLELLSDAVSEANLASCSLLGPLRESAGGTPETHLD